MSAIHYAPEIGIGDVLPICERVPGWAHCTNALEDVTCKWCLKKVQADRDAMADRMAKATPEVKP